jgi:hypothetical protein
MNTSEWIEQFTGLKVADGQAAGADPEAALKAFEEEQALKRMLLAKARKTMDGVKADFQKAMSQELKIKGKVLKQRMLAVDGTQLDELDVDEFDFAEVKLEKVTQDAIALGSHTIMTTGANLAGERIQRGDKLEPLFTAAELTEGFWFPLTRERILPETLAPDIYSKTKKMLDESNKLYLAAVEVKKEKGELTPKANRARSIAQSSAELLTVGADLAGGFAPGSAQAKLAGQVLNTLSAVISGADEGIDKLLAKEYADGATTFLGTVKVVTGAILSGAGVPKDVVGLVDQGFSFGSAAITAGKHFARGADGVSDGVGVLGGVLQGILQAAASNATKDPATQKALNTAAISLGTAIKGAGTSVKLLQALDADPPDTAAAFDCLCTLAVSTLNGVQDIRKLSASEAQAKEIDKQTQTGEKGAALGTAALKTSAAVAISLKRGSYQKAFDELIAGVGSGLATALVLGNLPQSQADDIAKLYQSAVSGVKALESMMTYPPDVEGALKSLGEGVSSALAAAAPDNAELKKAAQSITAAFSTLVSATQIDKLYSEGKHEEAIGSFISGVTSKLKGVLETGDLKGAVTGAKEAIGKSVGSALQAVEAKAAKEEALKEARATLDEAEADLVAYSGRPANQGAVSDAEALAREASDIEKLIAKMQRDQMIMKIALQVMQGGTAFLASFVPALGAASAAIQMMASLQAAAARAQQLHSWVQNQSDFAAAQSALTSSAQNFVKNQAEQFTHHAIQAAFAAAELIGNVIDVAGAGAMGAGPAVGASMKAAAKAGAKIEEIIYKHVKQEELEYAWKITKRSLNNPSNRKLGLQARALNPTLAKYSIAWGAVSQKDPLARNALVACDLTEAVLDSPTANVDKVVEYLETFYEEDDKLYRELVDAADWVPAELTLTLRCWVQLKTAAVKSIKLGNPDTGVIDGYLVQLKGSVSKMDLAAVGERIQLLQSLDAELAAYVPVVPNIDKKKQFESAVTLLRNQAKAAIGAAEARRESLEEAAAEKAKGVLDSAVATKSEAQQKVVAMTEGKAAEQRKADLAKEEFVIKVLDGAIGSLNSLSEDVDLDELQGEVKLATKILQEVSATDFARLDGPVKARIKQARARVQDIEFIVAQAEQLTA